MSKLFLHLLKLRRIGKGAGTGIVEPRACRWAMCAAEGTTCRRGHWLDRGSGHWCDHRHGREHDAGTDVGEGVGESEGTTNVTGENAASRRRNGKNGVDTSFHILVDF